MMSRRVGRFLPCGSAFWLVTTTVGRPTPVNLVMVTLTMEPPFDEERNGPLCTGIAPWRQWLLTLR